MLPARLSVTVKLTMRLTIFRNQVKLVESLDERSVDRCHWAHKDNGAHQDHKDNGEHKDRWDLQDQGDLQASLDHPAPQPCTKEGVGDLELLAGWADKERSAFITRERFTIERKRQMVCAHKSDRKGSCGSVSILPGSRISIRCVCPCYASTRTSC